MTSSESPYPAGTITGYLPVYVPDKMCSSIYTIHVPLDICDYGRGGLYDPSQATYTLLELFKVTDNNISQYLVDNKPKTSADMKHVLTCDCDVRTTGFPAGAKFFLNQDRALEQFYAQRLHKDSCKKTYEDDGKLKSLVSYRHDTIKLYLKHGECRKYNNGVLIKFCQYRDGKKHNRDSDRALTYYPDGSKKTSCSYKDGKLHGSYHMWASASEGGSSLRSAEYKDGILVGEERIITPNGRLVWHRNDEGKLDGSQYIHSADAGTKLEQHWTNGIKTGTWIKWDERKTMNNTLESWDYDKEGELRRHTVYDKNLEIKDKYEYSKGKLIGGYRYNGGRREWVKSSEYEELVRPDRIIHKNQGKDKQWKVTEYQSDNLMKLYHLNSNLKLDGLYIVYNCSGDVIMRMSYRDGKRHGVCEIYDDNLNLVSHIEYVHGKRHGDFWIKDVNKYGMLNGERAKCTENVQFGTYKFGKLHGVYHCQAPKGTVVERTQYEYGMKMEKSLKFI